MADHGHGGHTGDEAELRAVLTGEHPGMATTRRWLQARPEHAALQAVLGTVRRASAAASCGTSASASTRATRRSATTASASSTRTG